MLIKPELVVFDLAGTTVKDNHDVHRVLQMALNDYHVSITLEEANAVMGIPKPVAIEKLLVLHQHPDITTSLISDIHHLFVTRMIDFYKHDPGVCENDGVSDTFRQLRTNGIRIAVDTGFDRPITEPLLARMGWIENGLIDVSITSDEVAHGRPHPDMIFRATELTGIKNPAMVAKCGDTASDIQEGTAAGCGWVIGITSGAFSREELQLYRPTQLIDSVSEILEVFGIK